MEAFLQRLEIVVVKYIVVSVSFECSLLSSILLEPPAYVVREIVIAQRSVHVCYVQASVDDTVH